jgi:hypothetical protein
MGDLENIPEAASAAVGAIGDELTFTLPVVRDIVKLCSVKKIAVLGVELFTVRHDGLYDT